uniref:Secreted protein n=1 Tax=Triticum urartu TaxID=4572 RepID=A0A8R7UDN7_TRIUA
MSVAASALLPLLRPWATAVVSRGAGPMAGWGETGGFGAGSWLEGRELRCGASVACPSGCRSWPWAIPPPPPFPILMCSRFRRCSRRRWLAGGLGGSLDADLLKVSAFGDHQGGLEAERRLWRREARWSWADRAARVRAGSHGRLGGMAAGGWRSGVATERLEHRGSPLDQSRYWPTKAASADVVPLPAGFVVVLPPPTRHSG